MPINRKKMNNLKKEYGDKKGKEIVMMNVFNILI